LKIKVLTSGTLATVQDLGRLNWRSNGVPLGGAADTSSHRLANFLVKNDGSTATLEIAGGGFRAQVEEAGFFAVCGAGGQIFIDKKNVGNGRLVFAPEGSEIEIRATQEGNYAYLAVAGGWDVPQVLGSRSTCLSASFGGLEGRGLRKGDELRSICPADEADSKKIWSSKWFVSDPTFRKLATFGKLGSTAIRVLPGPEIHWWDAKEQEQFFTAPFVVSKQRDRMGVRLEANLTFRKSGTMLSTAVAPGTVQVPPNGQPIALLADAQTTGGYPRIAQVIAVDIPRLAQIPSGQTVYFQKVSLEEAERLFFEQENFFKKLQLAVGFVAR